MVSIHRVGRERATRFFPSQQRPIVSKSMGVVLEEDDDVAEAGGLGRGQCPGFSL